MSSIQISLWTKIKFLLKHGPKISNPLLIYQMGKVASTSIYLSLKSTTNYNVFHAHYLNPENILKIQKKYKESGKLAPNLDEGFYLYKRLFNNTKIPVKIISLVREPISRNMSAFFQNLNFFQATYPSYDFSDTNQLIECFLENYNHDTPLEWFDTELKFATSIDIYEQKFDSVNGYITINSYPYEVLILKHDLSDSKKEECIAKFLGLSSFRIARENEASSKSYFDSYKKFTNSIKIPKTYAENMLESKYSKHFYSSQEIDNIYRKWLVS